MIVFNKMTTEYRKELQTYLPKGYTVLYLPGGSVYVVAGVRVDIKVVPATASHRNADIAAALDTDRVVYVSDTQELEEGLANEVSDVVKSMFVSYKANQPPVSLAADIMRNILVRGIQNTASAGEDCCESEIKGV